jgi:hypothetical protein
VKPAMPGCMVCKDHDVSRKPSKTPPIKPALKVPSRDCDSDDESVYESEDQQNIWVELKNPLQAISIDEINRQILGLTSQTDINNQLLGSLIQQDINNQQVNPGGPTCCPVGAQGIKGPQGVTEKPTKVKIHNDKVLDVEISDRMNPAKFYIKTREQQKEIVKKTYHDVNEKITASSNLGNFSTTYTIDDCSKAPDGVYEVSVLSQITTPDYLISSLFSLLKEDGFTVSVTCLDGTTTFAISWEKINNDKFIAMMTPGIV